MSNKPNFSISERQLFDLYHPAHPCNVLNSTVTPCEFSVANPFHDMHRMPSERLKHGVTEMNSKALVLTLASLLLCSASTAIACDYKAGETKFADYANCRYGADSIKIAILPEDFVWDECVYYFESFMPPKLLAVTRDKNGKEVVSVNDRSKIGNPCYLTKHHCDAALKAAGS